MPSGSGHGGAAEAAGARKSVAAAAGDREGMKELKLLARKMDRLVRAAFGSPPKPLFVQAGHRFLVRPSNFFYCSCRLRVLIYAIFLARTHN
jgi:hypothetical protein